MYIHTGSQKYVHCSIHRQSNLGATWISARRKRGGNSSGHMANLTFTHLPQLEHSNLMTLRSRKYGNLTSNGADHCTPMTYTHGILHLYGLIIWKQNNHKNDHKTGHVCFGGKPDWDDIITTRAQQSTKAATLVLKVDMIGQNLANTTTSLKGKNMVFH